MTGEELFWDLAKPLLSDAAVTRSTMMGFPCLRLDGRFLRLRGPQDQALLVKLPAHAWPRLIAMRLRRAVRAGRPGVPRVGRVSADRPAAMAVAVGRRPSGSPSGRSTRSAALESDFRRRVEPGCHHLTAATGGHGSYEARRFAAHPTGPEKPIGGA